MTQKQRQKFIHLNAIGLLFKHRTWIAGAERLTNETLVLPALVGGIECTAIVGPSGDGYNDLAGGLV